MVQVNASLDRSECRYNEIFKIAYVSSPLYLGALGLARVHGGNDLAVGTATNENVVSTAGLDHR